MAHRTIYVRKTEIEPGMKLWAWSHRRTGGPCHRGGASPGQALAAVARQFELEDGETRITIVGDDE